MWIRILYAHYNWGSILYVNICQSFRLGAKGGHSASAYRKDFCKGAPLNLLKIVANCLSIIPSGIYSIIGGVAVGGLGGPYFLVSPISGHVSLHVGWLSYTGPPTVLTWPLALAWD